MALESLYKESISLKLRSGDDKTVTTAIAGTVANADKDKVWAVVGALLPILEYPLHRALRTTTTVIDS